MENKTILIVDDEKPIVVAIETLLKSTKKYTVYSATNSKDALNVIKKHKINLVILDVNLNEDINGFDLFYKIVDIDNKLEVMFLTAIDAEATKRYELLNSGAFDYLLKPVDSEMILASVKSAFQKFVIKGTRSVGYGDIAIEKAPMKLSTILGSCVSVIFYEPQMKIAGMTHIMIPVARTRYDTRGANEAINVILDKMTKLGVNRKNLKCYMYGGASKFEANKSIGKENINMARDVLGVFNIPIIKEDVGGSKGRKILFDIAKGTIDQVFLG